MASSENGWAGLGFTSAQAEAARLLMDLFESRPDECLPLSVLAEETGLAGSAVLPLLEWLEVTAVIVRAVPPKAEAAHPANVYWRFRSRRGHQAAEALLGAMPPAGLPGKLFQVPGAPEHQDY